MSLLDLLSDTEARYMLMIGMVWTLILVLYFLTRDQ